MANSGNKNKPVSLKIVGLILSESYQRCKLFAARLHKHHKKNFLQPSITGLLDMDWTDYINKLRKEIGGKSWALKESVVVFLNDSFLGGEADLFGRFRNYLYENPPPEKIKEEASNEYSRYLNRDNLIYTFMELSLDGEYMGTLLFQLRYDLLPRTSLWFTEFCTHERFTYRGTKIHRVCKRGWFQSGEMLSQREWSLQSLDDENYCYKHDRRGILSFANKGKHTNQFQFFVTFQRADWMDGRNVAFGRVVEGSDVLRRIECTPCTYESPDRDIVITNCGLAKVGYGRAIDPSLRLGGITVGLPHLHLEFFIELLFDKFDQILFDRLDEEVKKLIDGKWAMEMIWEKVMAKISMRSPPTDDVLDVRDRPSGEFVVESFIAGLYSLPDIPDLFIMSLLNEALKKATERSEIKEIAKSVVNVLVNSAFDEATVKDQIAEGIVYSLVDDVLRIIFGSQSLDKDSSSSVIGIQKTLSEIPDLNKSLSDLKKRAGHDERVGQDSKERLSVKESVAAFVWGILLELLSSVTPN